MTANRLTSFLLMVIVFSPITDIFSDALWDDNITDAQHMGFFFLVETALICYNYLTVRSFVFQPSHHPFAGESLAGMYCPCTSTSHR